jgi:hypothetical protein
VNENAALGDVVFYQLKEVIEEGSDVFVLAI